LVSVVCILAAIIFRFVLIPIAPDGAPFVTFSPAVLIATIWAGPSAGTSALLLGSLAAAYISFDRTEIFDLSVAQWAALATFWLTCLLLIIIGTLVRARIHAVAAAQEQARTLSYEMRHRMHNLIGIVQAVSHQTLKNAPTPLEYQKLFDKRLTALARAQDLILDNPTLPTDLQSLLDHVLEPFDAARIELTGASVGVPQEIGSSLALLINELATNSVKYGSLSVSEGRVFISWAWEKNGVRLEWRETRGPPVVAPTRTGFGSRLLSTAFPPGQGEASIAFEPDGVKCQVLFPANPSKILTLELCQKP
jgi:two-component sensor histidine kinase